MIVFDSVQKGTRHCTASVVHRARETRQVAEAFERGTRFAVELTQAVKLQKKTHL